MDAWVFFSLSFLYSFLCMEGHVEDCSRDLYFFLIHFEDYFAFFNDFLSLSVCLFICLSIYFSIYITFAILVLPLSLSFSPPRLFSRSFPLSSFLKSHQKIDIPRQTDKPTRHSHISAYWFYYGYQDTCSPGAGAHDADWEHIIVKVSTATSRHVPSSRYWPLRGNRRSGSRGKAGNRRSAVMVVKRRWS